MANVYLVARKEEFFGCDSTVSMVVVAEDEKDALNLALEQDWGACEVVKQDLIVTKVDTSKRQLVLVHDIWQW